MVSLWPWKGDDTASFEKTLSALSEKIKKASIKNEGLRTRSRRYKALWTLYTSLAYTIGSLILVLVTGWRNWGAVEYGVVIGGPFVIYLVRAALAAYYNYRLSNNQTYLDDLNQQRESAIEKFKAATKYNSTQQLLEKYGAAPASSSSSRASPSTSSATKRQVSNSDPQRQRQTRTNMAPPPTANIRRPEGPSASSQTPQNTQPTTPTSNRMQALIPAAFPLSQSPDTTADFAPNAFSAPPQYSTSTHGTSHDPKWYDRMLDVLLGEDETRAINRLALICAHCRLVNGQAPPGMKRLEDVGRWRCSGCGGWNGEESEARRIIEAAGATGRDVRHKGSGNSRTEEMNEGLRKRKPEMSQKSKVDGAFDESVEEEHEDTAARDNASSAQEEEDTTSSPESKVRARSDSPDGDDSSAGVDDTAVHTSPARSTRSRTKNARKTR